jgi:hypothetical protein
MMTRSRANRLLVLAVLAWLIGVTAGRDVLHNHAACEECRDCPACFIECSPGITAATSALIAATFTLVVVGPAPGLLGVALTADDLSYQLPPRSPPCSR